jgi:hypothetical protein
MTERAFHEQGVPSDIERTWLARLAPGDQVIVQEHGRDRLGSVEQRLPSGRLLVTWEGGTQEFGFDGRLRTSGTYTGIFLVEPTAYRKSMIEKQQLARYLAEQEWLQMPLDTLRQIAALVQGARADWNNDNRQ